MGCAGGEYRMDHKTGHVLTTELLGPEPSGDFDVAGEARFANWSEGYAGLVFDADASGDSGYAFILRTSGEWLLVTFGGGQIRRVVAPAPTGPGAQQPGERAHLRRDRLQPHARHAQGR